MYVRRSFNMRFSVLVDAGKMCMVIESESRDWVSLKSAGGDVVFKNEYCCVPEMMVDGVLCTRGEYHRCLESKMA